MKWLDFLHVDTNSLNIKIDQKYFWVDMVGNGCGLSGHKILKLAAISRMHR